MTTIKTLKGEYVTLDNIFGVLIGKCIILFNEYRASKASYTAQEFNFTK